MSACRRAEDRTRATCLGETGHRMRRPNPRLDADTSALGPEASRARRAVRGVAGRSSPYPELVEQHAPLGVVLVVAHALRDEVGGARVDERDPRRAVGELV